MATIVRKAPHFEVASKALGATDEQIEKNADNAVELALATEKKLVDVRWVGCTLEDPQYRGWQRIKVLKSGLRVVVEVYPEGADLIVLIHLVVPRTSWIYEEICKLWEQYRSKV